MKSEMITIRVSDKEKTDLKKLAKEDGHNSVGGFIMWLIRQYKEGRLVMKR